VQNLATGAYVEGALVTLTPARQTALTARDGSFYFSSLPPGEYQVSVSYTGLDAQTASVELKRLRFQGKLGSRARTEVDAKTGETRIVPNDQYWEAMFKYYEGTRQWAKTDPSNEDAQKELEAVKIYRREGDFFQSPATLSLAAEHTLSTPLLPGLAIPLADLFA
jgi:hypothetical protein